MRAGDASAQAAGRAHELVDVFVDDGRPLGSKRRADVHRTGDWHVCFHCIVVSGTPDRPVLMLQRRGRTLEDYPGLIDVTVAGHVIAGENVEMAAVREIREELGVDVRFEALEKLGSYPLVVRQGDIWSRERTEIFALRDDRDVSAYRPDAYEVESLVVIDAAAACALWRGEIPTAKATEHRRAGTEQIALSAADFVNDVPEYWPYLARRLLT